MNYDKVIEKLESLKISYGDYGTDDDRATNEALDIAIRLVKKERDENEVNGR